MSYKVYIVMVKYTAKLEVKAKYSYRHQQYLFISQPKTPLLKNFGETRHKISHNRQTPNYLGRSLPQTTICRMKISPPISPPTSSQQTHRFSLLNFLRLDFLRFTMQERTQDPPITLQALGWFFLNGTRCLLPLLIFFSYFLSKLKSFISDCFIQTPGFLFPSLFRLRDFALGHDFRPRFFFPVPFSKFESFSSQVFVSHIFRY